MNVIAVDVGTTSVRLAIVAFKGNDSNEAYILASHHIDISHRQRGNLYEQSSSEIWRAICECSSVCIRRSRIPPESIESIAFSATCSLVVVEAGSEAVEDDVIMWMDHRATEQANRITASGSEVLSQFGGVCSPEFSLAKLMWLKENEPQRFAKASGFFELPDWLVYRCLGVKPKDCPRSLCSVVCKWGYDPDMGTYPTFSGSLNLASMQSQIGQRVMGPGSMSGILDDQVAVELGLFPESGEKENRLERKIHVVVATSLIDAHSGMLAMLSVPTSAYQDQGHLNNRQQIESTFCSLAGTSSCHMLLSASRNFTRGIWGPYKNVVLDGYYLLEAGQSLTGKLIEICIESHEEGRARLARGERVRDIIASLNEQLKSFGIHETEQLIILPTFHGNRSPLANPRLKGGIYGLSAARQESLLEYYAATVDALVYEFKLIIERMNCPLETILVSGGLMKNEFFMQTLADVMGCTAVRMDLGEVDFMVMGSALVARHAAILNRCMQSDFKGHSEQPIGETSIRGISYQQLDVIKYAPNNARAGSHEKRYRCYKEFVNYSLIVDQIMHPGDE